MHPMKEREHPNKSCGACAMCCKLPKIDQIGKPMGRWCEHCKPGREGACGIFGKPERPQICGDYFCVWRMTDLPDELRPDRCGFILDTSDEDPETLRVMVEPSKPDAWRHGPGGRMLERLQRKGITLIVVIDDRRKMVRMVEAPASIEPTGGDK